eukprot:3614787-Amphidinium_carterae.1
MSAATSCRRSHSSSSPAWRSGQHLEVNDTRVVDDGCHLESAGHFSRFMQHRASSPPSSPFSGCRCASTSDRIPLEGP